MCAGRWSAGLSPSFCDDCPLRPHAASRTLNKRNFTGRAKNIPRPRRRAKGLVCVIKYLVLCDRRSFWKSPVLSEDPSEEQAKTSRGQRVKGVKGHRERPPPPCPSAPCFSLFAFPLPL